MSSFLSFPSLSVSLVALRRTLLARPTPLCLADISWLVTPPASRPSTANVVLAVSMSSKETLQTTSTAFNHHNKEHLHAQRIVKILCPIHHPHLLLLQHWVLLSHISFIVDFSFSPKDPEVIVTVLLPYEKHSKNSSKKDLSYISLIWEEN